MGIVVDKKRAADGPCDCIPTIDGNLLCFHHGVVGALSHEQRASMCGASTPEGCAASPNCNVHTSRALTENEMRFRDTVERCKTIATSESTEPGIHWEDFIACVQKEGQKYHTGY